MTEEQHRHDRSVGRTTGAVIAAWLAAWAVVAWGFWQQARIDADRCADTFRDLGAEVDADPDRIDTFLDRIEARYADLPDPC